MQRFRRQLLLPLILGVVGAIALTVNGGVARAATPTKTETAAEWKFHAIVDVQFVMQYAQMPKPENVLIVDSRPKRPKYDKGYIPTAISIPFRKFDEMVDKLPQDKNALLIFYCGGPT